MAVRDGDRAVEEPGKKAGEESGWSLLSLWIEPRFEGLCWVTSTDPP